MTFNPSQLELITQGVLRELRLRGVDITSAASPQNRPGHVPSTSPPATSPAAADEAARITDRVITEESLAALQIPAGRTVAISADAVITPSGRDYLRHHRHTVRTATASPTGKSGLLITMDESGSFAAAAAAAAASWQKTKAGCHFDAARKAVAAQNAVVCCVPQPSVVACLLNRQSHLRAAVINATTDLASLTTTMNPKVACLNSTGWSFAAARQLLRTMSTRRDAVPTGWKELRGGAQ